MSTSVEEKAAEVKTAKSDYRARRQVNWAKAGPVFGIVSAFAALLVFALGGLVGGFLWPSVDVADLFQDSRGRQGLVVGATIASVLACAGMAFVSIHWFWSSNGEGAASRSRTLLVVGVMALVAATGFARMSSALELGKERIVERAEAKYDVDIEGGLDGVSIKPDEFVIDGVEMDCDLRAFEADTFDPVLRCEPDDPDKDELSSD